MLNDILHCEHRDVIYSVIGLPTTNCETPTNGENTNTIMNDTFLYASGQLWLVYA